MTFRFGTTHSVFALGLAVIASAVLFGSPALAQTTDASQAPGAPVAQTYYKGTILGASPTTNDVGAKGSRYSVEFCCDANGNSQTQVITQVFTSGDLNIVEYKKGDRVVILETPGQEGNIYYITDYYRIPKILWIAGIFVVIALFFGRKKALASFAGLAFSFVTLMWVIVPQIVRGADPMLVGMGGAIVIAMISIFVAHGFHKKTVLAAEGTLITIGLAIAFSWFAVRSAHLLGRGSEDAIYVLSIFGGRIDLQGLLLAGIIIGTLGVLDDITTSITATIEEIHKANDSFHFKELYRRGLNVGHEHIASLINTLVLAYAGAALPLMLLFTLPNQPAWVALNSQLISEEIIRALIGSAALVLAVPITTALAARAYAADTARTTGGRSKEHAAGNQQNSDHGHTH